MIDIVLDKHVAEDIKAINILKEHGYTEEEIQRLYDEQKKKDEEEEDG